MFSTTVVVIADTLSFKGKQPWCSSNRRSCVNRFHSALMLISPPFFCQPCTLGLLTYHRSKREGSPGVKEKTGPLIEHLWAKVESVLFGSPERVMRDS